MVILRSAKDMHDRVGTELGVSAWHTVTQAAVDAFAEITGDRYWIHTDPERAARESPFGGTIAHGYYTLSLEPQLSEQILTIEGFSVSVNYGANKVRFPAPLPVGRRVRMRLTLSSVEDLPGGGVQLVCTKRFEVEGGEKPVCVAETVSRSYP